jgi:hypothetical protein
MPVVVGPVLTREGGFAFDSWTQKDGLSRGYVYRRIEDAYYARNAELRASDKADAGATVACGTADEFARATV